MTNIPYKQRKQYVKNIGVVFGQKSQLHWDLPLIESFELMKYIYKIPKKVYEEKIDVVVLVGTRDILDSISDLKSFYKNKYGEEMNVSVLILKNLDILINWCIENKYSIPTVDIFSGEIWHTSLGEAVLEKLLAGVENGF